MANVLIKGIPQTLYQKLKRRAQEDLRSLTQEIIWILSRGITESDSFTDGELDKLERLAEKTKSGKTVRSLNELDRYLRSLKK